MPDNVYVPETDQAQSAATVKISNLTQGKLELLTQGVAAGYKFARGQHTTVAASDTVVTGLATVVAAIAVIETDVDGVTLSQVTCQIGDQAGSPAAGSIIIKTWKATSVSNPTLIATTVFSKKVNWIAIGT